MIQSIKFQKYFFISLKSQILYNLVNQKKFNKNQSLIISFLNE
jgi:hypothetical protein